MWGRVSAGVKEDAAEPDHPRREAAVESRSPDPVALAPSVQLSVI